jgi:hypothetical protein
VESVKPWLAVLLAARFLLELALLAAYAVAIVRLVPGALGWLLAIVAAAVVGAVWGALLSPRRPVALPLAARVAIELVLFGGAALLLAAAGLGGWAVALVVGELAVLGLLRGPDRYAPEVPERA